MRKIYSLLVMLFVGIMGFSASAATRNVTFDIDNPNNVIVSQEFDGSNAISLSAGVNTVALNDPYGYGASFYVIANPGVSFTTITRDGKDDLSDAYESDGRMRYSGYTGSGTNYVIRTSSGGGQTSAATAVINIDNASAFSNGWIWTNSNNPISLTDGRNTISFNPNTDNPFRFTPADGEPFIEFTKNGSSVDFDAQAHAYYVTIANNDYINIVTGAAAPTQYTVSWGSGCNLDAITNFTVNGQSVSDWRNGFPVNEGSYIMFGFDMDNYDISDFTVNGYEYTAYSSNNYIYISGNTTISFTATQKAVTHHSATFTLLGWEQQGFGIKFGGSAYDDDITVSATSFPVTFTEDAQDFYIYTTGDYRLDRVSVTHDGTTSNKTIYGSGPHYCVVNVADGDVVEVSISKFIDVYTATLNVNLQESDNYDGYITISNSSSHINGEQVYNGPNTFKFNPNDSSDRTFTINANAGNLYSVKKDNVTINGNNGVYSLGQVTDNCNVEIIAVDPNSIVVTPARLIFSDENNNAAIRTVMINNVDIDASDYAAGNIYTGANVGNTFMIYFNPDWVISDLVFGDVTYNYDPERSVQPLNLLDDAYQFTGTITDDVMTLSFTATYNAVTYSKVVTFNVNIPAGAKITDITDSQSHSAIPVTGTQFTHTFIQEYNYINIESNEGYNLVSVTVNPNNGYEPYNLSISDNKVTNIMPDNGYIISIDVEEIQEAPQYGSFTVNVSGDPAGVSLSDDNHNAFDVVNTSNTFNLDSEYLSLYLMANDGFAIDAVTIDGHEISATGIYYNFMVTANSVVNVTVSAASVSNNTLTVNVEGDPSKFTFMKQGTSCSLQLGTNIFQMTSQTEKCNITSTTSLYSVEIDGTEVIPMVYGGIYIYSFDATFGSTLNIVTDEPAATPVFTLTVSGDASTLSLSDENRISYTLATGANTIEMPDENTSVQFMLQADTAPYIIEFNGTPMRPTYGTTYFFYAKAGDQLVIDTEYPVIDVQVSWDFQGCDSGVITGIRIGGADQPLISADEEDFANYINGFQVAAGTSIEFHLDNSNYTLTGVSINGVASNTSTIQTFAPSQNTVVTISAITKRIYDFTLRTNMPQAVMVYSGAYGFGQPIHLDGNSNTLQIDEISGNTYITVGLKYGYEFEAIGCTVNSNTITIDNEGYYIIYPQENDVVEINVKEVDRPYKAVIYVDNIEKANRIALYCDRFTAFASDEEGAGSGYTVFRFNNNDLGGGLTLYAEAANSEVTPWIYINNERATAYNAETHQLSGIQVSDGDVIKVYFVEEEQQAPQVSNVVFNHPEDPDEADMFTITIDHINTYKGSTRLLARAAANSSSTEALTGTEITISASEEAEQPCVIVDGNVNPFPAGGSYTFAVTGDHNIYYGQHNTLTIIELIKDSNDNAPVNIYNIQGVCIKSNATSEDVRSLTPGLYIIGGQKVRVK